MMSSGPEAGQGFELITNQSFVCRWDGQHAGEVHVHAVRHLDDGRCEISVGHSIAAGQDTVFLHWGVTDAPDGAWGCPPSTLWPEGTSKHSDQAAETAMPPGAHPVRIVVPRGSAAFDLKFVVKHLVAGQPRWYGAGPGDFRIACRRPDGEFARRRVLAHESDPGASLWGRYAVVMELLDVAQSDANVMAWLYVVLRFHHGKQLPWYGKYNYQSKDIAHVQDTLSRRMALAAMYAPDPRSRRLARMAIGFLSRGGGLSEQIRLQVLDMMRRHGIREGHRPGIEDRFLEQWHQKLHQNTTAEDIVICEAYLHFLHTGREGDFWHALWERGRISREQLATMPNPITASPRHLPQLIPDLQRYLWTLKTVHAGADLSFMIEAGKWALEQAGDQEAIRCLYEIRDHFGAWWIPGKIAQVRARLVAPCKRVFAAERDLLLLDAALAGGFRTAVERVDLAALDGDALIELVDLVLSQVVLSGDDHDAEACLRQWRAQVKEVARWSPDWALRAAAAAERLALQLQHDARALHDLLEDKASELARAARIPAAHALSFSEEVVRGQPAFLLSLLLHRLTPMLRRTAGLGPWNLVSLGAGAGSVEGRVLFLDQLGSTLGTRFREPTVLVLDRLEGSDDLPAGTRAVLAAGSVDVLSHVAIRARNQGVLLACAEAAVLAEVKARHRESEWLSLRIPPDARPGDLAITEGGPPSAEAGAASAELASRPAPRSLPVPAPWRGYLVQQSDFRPGVVGAKASNLARLASALPPGLATPESVALPLGSLEATLALPGHAALAETVLSCLATAQQALASGDGQAMSSALRQLRADLVSGLVLHPDLERALQEVLHQFERPDGELAPLWHALRRVWASKWTDRAFVARAPRNGTTGVADDALVMGVLIQRLVPADYAFVLHTVNPVPNPSSADEPTLLGEVVVGLGESLAASHPGQPFRFVAPRSGARSPARGGFQVRAYPSKRTGLFADPGDPGLMVRSDCNGEDLDDLAGAGLYDSVACATLQQRVVDYAACPLFQDEGFRSSLVGNLRWAGLDVEAALGGRAQDVEGVIVDGRVTIVQARPQVGLAR